MNVEVMHEFLVNGGEAADCCRRVESFLDRNILLRYQDVDIDPSLCVSGADPSFWPRVEDGIAANRECLRKMLADLEENGFGRTADFIDMDQGFISKTLHTVVHLLDGFIGIDSAFYNLADDSHWISQGREERIRKEAEKYHLVRAVGRCHGSSADLTGFFRHFEE